MDESKMKREKLLNDKGVIAEIERHLWLESEKAGYDIGFEKAKEDWLNRFALEWMKYHMPTEVTAVAPKVSSSPKKKNAKAAPAKIKLKKKARPSKKR